MRRVALIVIAVVLLAQCKRDFAPSSAVAIDTPLTPYTVKVPPHFAKPYLNDYNPLTVEGVELGRRLFYDSILSTNGRSCSYCHPQSQAFTSTLASHSLDPSLYPNIPAFVNEAWNPYYGWDGAYKDMDHIAIADFGPMFFNSNINEVISRLKGDPTYSNLFRKVFKGQDVFQPGVIQEKVAFAAAQFIRTIISSNSKFDRYMLGIEQLTPQEANGYDIFFSEKGDCFHCHGTMLFTDNAFHNTGLDTVFEGFGRGRFNITGLTKDMGLFRTPTLRNIALTSPYMHDGRYATLDEVIEHYNSGVHRTATIDPIMTLPGKEMGLQLSNQEKQDLKAFLLTLTDTTILSNPDYGRIR
jgi:cytochrome c peroxidase